MNITVEKLNDALADRDAHAVKKLRAAIQDAVESAPADKQDAYRRFHCSALAADDEIKDTCFSIAMVFMVECIRSAPPSKRDAVSDAVRELVS